MALLKKVNAAWRPSENLDLKVGETQDISDYVSLVRQGLAILVDEDGNEMPLPGEMLTCPICYQKIPGVLANFTEHVNKEHSSTKTAKVETPAPVVKEVLATEEVTTPAVTEAPELTTADKRRMALEKARQAKAAKAAEKVA